MSVQAEERVRSCSHCEAGFVPAPHNRIKQRFCSKACRNAHWNKGRQDRFTLDQLMEVLTEMEMPVHVADQIIDGLSPS